MLSTALTLWCTLLFAQTTQYKKIAQRHDVYASSAWTGTDSFRWQYNSMAWLTQLNALKGNAGNWSDIYRYTYWLNTNGQVTEQLRENWNGSAWVNNNHYLNTYDTDSNLLGVLYEVWNGGAWSSAGKIDYAGYNTHHHYGSELVWSWNGSTWIYLSKTLFQYYPNGYQTMSEEDYNWNTGLGLWDSIERKYYTYYGDSVSSITHSIPFNGNWFLQNKEVFTYNTTAPFLRQTYLTQTWDTTQSPAAWLDNRQKTYTYNTGNLVESIQQDKYITLTAPAYWEAEEQWLYQYSGGQLAEYNDNLYMGGSWTPQHKSTYTYSGSNLIQEEQSLGSGMSWLLDKQLHYQYDANNLNTFRQIDTFNGAVFCPNNRDFYYYNAFTTGLTDLQTTPDCLSLYPVPANQDLHVALTDHASGPLMLRVYDASGHVRIIRNEYLPSGNKEAILSTRSLEPGVYLLQVNSSRSISFTIYR